MTPVDALILLLENFQTLAPLAQLGAATSCIGALGGSIFWAWRKGRKYVAQLVETNGKLKQKLKDSAVRTMKIKRRIEDRRRTLAILQAQVPAAILAQAAADKAHARDILSALFDQLAPAVATCCREMAEVELALTVDAEDRPHRQRAKRLAQAAVLLAPEGDGGLRDLLAEIKMMAAHESPRTTKLYDRTSDAVSLDEVERVVF